MEYKKQWREANFKLCRHMVVKALNIVFQQSDFKSLLLTKDVQSYLFTINHYQLLHDIFSCS